MDDTPQETTSESESSTSGGGGNAVKIIGVIVVIIVLAFLVWQFALKPKTAENTIQPAVSPTPSEGASMEASPTAVMAHYKDGTYTAIGEYQNPASREQVNVSITLKDGVVTAATFTGTPDNPTTVTMQGKFKAGFQALVVGKPIDEINLTVVNGSSLAPKGFMDALSKIKEQAKG